MVPDSNYMTSQSLVFPICISLSILVSFGCSKRLSWTEWLKQWKIVSHSPRGWKALGQDVSWWHSWWANCSWIAEGYLLCPLWGIELHPYDLIENGTPSHELGFNTGVWRRRLNESCQVECTVLGMKGSQKVGQVSSAKPTESKETGKRKFGSEASYQLEGSN